MAFGNVGVGLGDMVSRIGFKKRVLGIWFADMNNGIQTHHIPATNWPSPPYASAGPIMMLGTLIPPTERLKSAITKVVNAKAPRPRGPASPIWGCVFSRTES